MDATQNPQVMHYSYSEGGWHIEAFCGAKVHVATITYSEVTCPACIKAVGRVDTIAKAVTTRSADWWTE